MFSLKDRVVYVSDALCDDKKLTGYTGRIVCDPLSETPGVEFDTFIGGHDACGSGRDGFCWFVDADSLELIERAVEESDIVGSSEEEFLDFLLS